MIKKSIQTKEITSVQIFCDRCGEEIRSTYGSKICPMCGRNVCSKCGHFYESDILVPDSFYGDYPEIVCKECWKIGEPFIKKIKEKEEEFEDLKEKLLEEWKNKCKETNP